MSIAAPDRPSRKGRWLTRLGFCVALAIGAGLLLRVLEANGTLLAALTKRGPDWRFIVCAVGCFLATQVIAMIRWWLLARAAGVPVGAREAFALGVAGETGNLLMPGANGGDALKMGLIVRLGLPVTRLLASIVADRIAGLLGLLSIGTIAGLLQWPHAPPLVRTITLVLGGLVATALVASWVFLHTGVLGAIARHCSPSSAARSVVDQLAAVAAAYRARLGSLAAAVGLSAVSQGFTLATMYCCGIAISRSAAPSLVSTLVCGPLVLVSMALPLPFGAIGVTEEVGERLFASLGFSGGGVAMLGYRACHLLAVAVLAMTYWMVRWLGGRRAAETGGEVVS